MVRVDWEFFMNHLINEGYDVDVHYNEDEDDENYDDNCITCPECREPIYEEDYPYVMGNGTQCQCPICETWL